MTPTRKVLTSSGGHDKVSGGHDKVLTTSGGHDFMTRAEFYHEIANYVKRDDFDQLKSKYDRLKRKIKAGNQNDDEEDYDQLIKGYGPQNLYDATKQLMHHAYTEKEILDHTVSG